MLISKYYNKVWAIIKALNQSLKNKNIKLFGNIEKCWFFEKISKVIYFKYRMADGVNLRFNTISCLDLDYQHFRSSFFMAKNG